MSMDRPKVGDYYTNRVDGKEHLVIGIGQHTGTNEIMIWHRGGSAKPLSLVTPLKRWSELINVPDGRRLFRFEWNRKGEENE